MVNRRVLVISERMPRIEDPPSAPFKIDLSGLPPRSWAYISSEDGRVMAIGASRYDLMQHVPPGADGFAVNVWVRTHGIC